MLSEVDEMSVKIRAHYDGKTFVPDEPVNMKVGEEVHVESANRTDTLHLGQE